MYGTINRCRLLAMFLILLATFSRADAQYGGGSGTADDPYQIATAAHLIALGETPGDYDKHFILTADIDLDPNLADGQVFDRAVIPHFSGEFNGNDHVISRLTIRGGAYLGLFGQLYHPASISNLGLEAGEVNGTGDCIGGLAGSNGGGRVARCFSNGQFLGRGWAHGGLIGQNSGTVIGCHDNGALRGNEDVGGLVGGNYGVVTRCRSLGSVSGSAGVGGLVGANYQGAAVTSCYSCSSVSGSHSVGGLVGRNGGGEIKDCYSTGAVSGEDYVGGLVGGGRYHPVTSCFWDIETSGQSSSAAGKGKLTSEMQWACTFLRAGWDFVNETANGSEDIWNILEGQEYPRLAWESPHPHDGAGDVVLSPTLSWFATREAVLYDVYFGDNGDEVAQATTESVGLYRGRWPREVTTYEPGTLEWGKTYYWRIDVVDGTSPNGLQKGGVWHFTTVAFAWPVEGIMATSNAPWEEGSGPENTVNGSGLDSGGQHSTVATDMWLARPGADPIWIQYEFDRVYKLHEALIWNFNEEFELVLGFGVKDAVVEYSEDGANWTAWGNVTCAQATAMASYTANTALDFSGLKAKFVRLNVKSGYGPLGQFGLSEVRFLYIPVWPRDPLPPDRATEVPVDSLLTWRAGREAVWHEVHLGTDEANLGSENTLVDRTLDNAVDPGALDLATTYYWKVNEVNETEAVSVWEGDVWKFTTHEFLVIDDFESYDDDNHIFDTWLDGWVNGTGSMVGGPFEGPFVYISPPTRSGECSMPFEYDNTNPPYYSETSRTWEVPQDWTIHGSDTLSLWVRGEPVSLWEKPDGTVVMSGYGSRRGWRGSDYGFVYRLLTGEGEIVARVDRLSNAEGWDRAGVMIRANLDHDSPYVATAATTAHGVSLAYCLGEDSEGVQTNRPGSQIPYWVKLTRRDNVFTAQQSDDGAIWQNISDAANEPVAVDVVMPETVYIGLCVSGSGEGVWGAGAATAAFTDIAFSGEVTGAWQTEEWSSWWEPTNSPDDLYVALQDSTGRTTVVVHPDPAAITVAEWKHWRVPFSTISDAGVDLTTVKTIYIGVGDRDHPVPAGTGMIHIDDICLTKRRTQIASGSMSGALEDGGR